MGRMLKALRKIEARGPQPAVEDAVAAEPACAVEPPPLPPLLPAPVTERTAEVLPAAEPLIVHTIAAVEAVEAAVAVANALCLPDIEPVVDAAEQVGRPFLADNDGLERPSYTPVHTPSGENASADPFDAIAERICAQSSPRAGKALMFTAPDDEAAHAGVMAPLAAALAARVGGDVLLLDGNPQQPDLTGQLGVQSAAGLADVLRGAVPWTEAIRPTTVPGLFLLPSRGLSQFSPERKWGCPPDDASRADARGAGLPPAQAAGTATPQMQPISMSQLLSELSAKYRMVLIAAPSLSRPGVANVTRHCRGTYLVVRLHRTSRRAVREAGRAIDRGEGRLLGCVAIGP